MRQLFQAPITGGGRSRTCRRAAVFPRTTNLAPHKNHENAFRSPSIYYEELDGRLECRMTGVNTKEILKSDMSHLKQLREIVAASSALKRQLKFMELPDRCIKAVKQQRFLWHPVN
jgi:hypothetical protein